MLQGIVKWFNDKKGFGFIECNGIDYFVHYKSISSEGHKTLMDGQSVKFLCGKGPKGYLANKVYID